MNDKVIITNISALKTKYGKGVSAITKAVKDLIAADKKRGIGSILVALDDPVDMTGLSAAAVTNANDPRQNKDAIDAIFSKYSPDYVLIIGAVDVIPHQDLKNPVYQPGSDDDQLALGDIPYACDKPYSKNPEDFVGPTRVVGRLPDLTGAKDPAYIVDLLATAAGYQADTSEAYSDYFSVSAAVWSGSTEMSLDNLFGSNKKLNLSPKAGPKWSSAVLGKRVHFINCHGAPASYQFYGQQGQQYPVAHDASLIKNNITEGTIVAAECCYGADLFDSFLLTNGQIGICSEYLASKAYGFFGSTTIAYGPADGNGSADLLCQYFLKYVMDGASIGRAALQARQDFASAAGTLDPVDVKTLAQFNLLGDPSITPVKVDASHNAFFSAKASEAKAVSVARSIERTERRQQLQAKGIWLSENQAVASSSAATQTSDSVQKSMAKIADKVGMKDPAMMTFTVEQPATAATLTSKSVGTTRFHVMLEDRSRGKNTRSKAVALNIKQAVCVVAKEVNGNIVSFRELHAR